MPRIKVRFILESSNKKQVPWRKHAVVGLALARDGRQAKGKTSKRPMLLRVCRLNLFGLPCVSFAGYAEKRE